MRHTLVIENVPIRVEMVTHHVILVTVPATLIFSILLYPKFVEALLQNQGFPSYQSGRVGWNAAWEGIYTTTVPPRYDSRCQRQIDLKTTSCNISSTRILQRDLTITTIAYAVGSRDVESKWMGLSPSAREEYILEGMTRTAAMKEGFEDCRIYCPEVTLVELQKSGGRPFVTLLKTFLIAISRTYPPSPSSFHFLLGMTCRRVWTERMKHIILY